MQKPRRFLLKTILWYRGNKTNLWKEDPVTRTSVWFKCKQSDTRHKEDKKQQTGKKSVDKGSMDQFPCRGFLKVIVPHGEDRDTVEVKFVHKCCHIPYVDISIPPKWKEFIQKNINVKSGQVPFFF